MPLRNKHLSRYDAASISSALTYPRVHCLQRDSSLVSSRTATTSRCNCPQVAKQYVVPHPQDAISAIVRS